MEDVTTETFEREGKIIMNHPAAHEYGETFVAFFGTVPYVCFHLWLLLGVGTDDCLIEENGVEPKISSLDSDVLQVNGVEPKHLL